MVDEDRMQLQPEKSGGEQRGLPAIPTGGRHITDQEIGDLHGQLSPPSAMQLTGKVGRTVELMSPPASISGLPTKSLQDNSPRLRAMSETPGMSAKPPGLKAWHTTSHSVPPTASCSTDTQYTSNAQKDQKAQFRIPDEAQMALPCSKRTVQLPLCEEQNLDMPIKLSVIINNDTIGQEDNVRAVPSNKVRTFDLLKEALQQDIGDYLDCCVSADTTAVAIVTHIKIVTADKVGTVVSASTEVIDSAIGYNAFINLLRYKHLPLTGFCICDQCRFSKLIPELTVHLDLFGNDCDSDGNCSEPGTEVLTSDHQWTIHFPGLVQKPKTGAQRPAELGDRDQPNVLVCFRGVQSFLKDQGLKVREIERLRRERDHLKLALDNEIRRRGKTLVEQHQERSQRFYRHANKCSRKRPFAEIASITTTRSTPPPLKRDRVDTVAQPVVIDLTSSPTSATSSRSDPSAGGPTVFLDDNNSEDEYNDYETRDDVWYGDPEDDNEDGTILPSVEDQQLPNKRPKLGHNEPTEEESGTPCDNIPVLNTASDEGIDCSSNEQIL